VGSLLRHRRVIGLAVVVAGLFVVAFWPAAVEVVLAPVARGELVVTVDEEGETRVRDRFRVSAPVAGRALRIELEPGDKVARGDVLARVQATTPSLLDARARAEAAAGVQAASAAIGRATAEEQRARTLLAHAERELTRSTRLAAAGAVPAQEVELRRADADVARDAVTAAEFAVRHANAELRRTRALAGDSANGLGRIVDVRAPVDGVVLRRLRESESVIPAGEPLVEIGDVRQTEIVSDLLSTDAVRVRVGARALVEQWGGQAVLAARVRQVEPAGFTKVSALGVEEQRVNVRLDFDNATPDCELLGDAYRVEVRIVIWEGSDVLKVPTSALFRDGTRWAVYVADGGRARRVAIELGHQTAVEAEVLTGLSDGQQVIVHPGERVAEGVRITPRID
jgi:HlyD family secretion protein